MEIKPYEIEFLDNVTKNDIPALPVTIERRVNKAIWERLTVSPNKLGKALSHRFKGYFRLRVGDYRIIYQIEVPEHKVLISAIRHRKDIYEYNQYGGGFLCKSLLHKCQQAVNQILQQAAIVSQT